MDKNQLVCGGPAARVQPIDFMPLIGALVAHEEDCSSIVFIRIFRWFRTISFGSVCRFDF